MVRTDQSSAQSARYRADYEGEKDMEHPAHPGATRGTMAASLPLCFADRHR